MSKQQKLKELKERNVVLRAEADELLSEINELTIMVNVRAETIADAKKVIKKLDKTIKKRYYKQKKLEDRRLECQS